MKKMMDAISHYIANVPGQVINRKWVVLFLFTLMTAVFVVGMTKLKFDFTIDRWLEQDDAAFLAYNEFHDQFGSEDGVVVVYKPKDGDVFSAKSLNTVKDIRNDLINYRLLLNDNEKSALDHIVKIDALTNAFILTAQDDLLISTHLISDKVPTSKNELDAIKRLAEEQKTLRLKYFSKDGKYAAIFIKTDFGAVPVDSITESPSTPNNSIIGLHPDVTSSTNQQITKKAPPHFKPTDMADYIALNTAINNILNKPEYANHFDYYRVGNTVDSENQVKMGQEMGVLYLAALGIMIVLLFILFRSFSGVIWPISVIIFTTIWTLGISGWLGLSASPFIILTILLILTMGMADTIHIISGYLFFRNEGHDFKSAMREAYEKAGVACLLTTFTTVVSILALSYGNVVPVITFSIMSSIGVAVAFFLTLYLLPVLMDIWSPVAKVKNNKNILSNFIERITPNVMPGLQRILDKIIPAVERRPFAYMAPFFVIFAVCVYGAFHIKVDYSIYDQYKPSSNFYQSIKLMDSEMSGSSRISLYVDLGKDNGFQDPEVLNVVDKLQQKLEKKYPDYVVTTSSIVDVVKDANMKLNSGDPTRYVIPETKQQLSQTLFMFNNADPEERSNLVDENYVKGNVTISVRTYGSYEYGPVFEQMKKDIYDSLGEIKTKYPDASISITGIFAMGMKAADYLIVNELQSFGMALLVISLILLIIFNSLKAGLISLVPNLIPSFLTLGILGLFNIPLDFYTMMLAPVIIGISVDDTVHFVSQYRGYVIKDGNIKRALTNTMKECGQSIIFTSLILGLGFGILSIASTPGYANVGKFGFLAILSGLICDLFLLPALIFAIKLNFQPKKKLLEPEAKSAQV